MTPKQIVLNLVTQLYWTCMRGPVLRQTQFVIVERKIDDVTNNTSKRDNNRSCRS